MRAVIGISASILVDNSKGFEGYKRAYVNDDYVKSVIQAGGIPLILPFNTNAEVTRALVNSIDGLILSGGHDVDPFQYGEEPQQKLAQIFPERDVFDITLIEECLKQHKPIFGICRGFQLLNVYFGGSLYQDFSYNEKSFIKHFQSLSTHLPSHTVAIKKESFIGSVFGESYKVNSFHHQLIKNVSPKMIEVAKAQDDVVEAIEYIHDDIFVIGVQWHPEMMAATDLKMNLLFEKFIQISKKNS